LRNLTGFFTMPDRFLKGVEGLNGIKWYQSIGK